MSNKIIQILLYLYFCGTFGPCKSMKEPINLGVPKRKLSEKYKGEKFPMKYLHKEVPGSTDDLDLYVKVFNRTLKYFSMFNSSNVNIASVFFFSRATLQRTVLQYGGKIDEQLEKTLKNFIKEIDFILSHLVYGFIQNLEPLQGFLFQRLGYLFRDKELLYHTLSDFNEGRLREWILSEDHMHDHVEAMDDLTLPMDDYTVMSWMHKNHFRITIDDSDYCVITLPPWSGATAKMHQCHRDKFCKIAIHQTPSIAYTLSHRLLNMVLRYFISRCYHESEAADLMKMDNLCASMYREAVYNARRGYFAKDLFLEQVGLCTLLGYEEFYRRSWFIRMANWINDQGCMLENKKLYNRMLYHNLIDRITINENEKNLIETFIKVEVNQDCHAHPTILNMMCMAAAIRQSVHHSTTQPRMSSKTSISDEL